ncbi:alpha/beta fold hydrolase [Actinospongicola halichondriae]|uniref:alpha/beta fold hydrolase n=1 Tax=Actinospongicola halichondriae TaxID=3236844 RepID=UPI003D4DF249
MPVVLVHGVPETEAIWDPLAERLAVDHGHEVVRLVPPGFGAPVPSDFDPVRESYVAWLTAELESIGGDVDLVGHDWGAGHSFGLVTTRPDLVRSWAMDVAGLMHPDYAWHDMAQLWRTPGVGEETVAGMMGASVDDKVALFESLGMPAEIGRKVALANDETMGRCILALYRSAGPEDLAPIWEALPTTAATKPGLVIVPSADTYVGPLEFSYAVAERAGAQAATLDGLGHWWMLEDPDQAAATLDEFWSTTATTT